MELLEQCKEWNNNEEYQKVVDALEILPENARTPEMDSELAKAYNNLGEPGDFKPFRQALGLLLPHEEYFRGNHRFYFRVAYSYFYLEEHGLALHYFKQALDARPGDEDTIDMMNECVNWLTDGVVAVSMSQKLDFVWENIQKEIRKYNKNSKIFHVMVADITAKYIGDAFPKIKINIFHDSKTLEFEAGDDKSNVFMLEYIKDTIPENIKELINIRVGISAKEDIKDIVVYEDDEYDISELRFFVSDDRQIVIYADEFDIPLEVIEQLFIDIFGEIDLMANDFEFDIADEDDFDAPTEDTCDIVLDYEEKEDFLKECVDYRGLKERAKSKGFRLGISAKEYLKMYSGYRLQSVGDDIREDIYTGTTCLPSLISEYISSGPFDKMPIMDKLYRNGVVAGFFCFSLEESDQENALFEYEFEVMNIRNQLIEYILNELDKIGKTGNIAFLEGATGKICGYLDFLIFGNFMDIMSSAYDFFEKKNIKLAGYKTFRKISKLVTFREE